MKQEFIPYEQALAMKELGFDEPCMGIVYTDNEVMAMEPGAVDIMCRKHSNCIESPLYQQAFRWFRKEHGIHAQIRESAFDDKYFILVSKDSIPQDTGTKYYPSYPAAELACLKKLIEISTK